MWVPPGVDRPSAPRLLLVRSFHFLHHALPGHLNFLQ